MADPNSIYRNILVKTYMHFQNTVTREPPNSKLGNFLFHFTLKIRHCDEPAIIFYTEKLGLDNELQEHLVLRSLDTQKLK